MGMGDTMTEETCSKERVALELAAVLEVLPANADRWEARGHFWPGELSMCSHCVKQGRGLEDQPIPPSVLVNEVLLGDEELVWCDWGTVETFAGRWSPLMQFPDIRMVALATMVAEQIYGHDNLRVVLFGYEV